MAKLTVNWTVTETPATPSVPPIDAWLVYVAQGQNTPVAEVLVADLTARTAELDNVPNGDNYVVTVALVSSDRTVVGPQAQSDPFNVYTLPNPQAITVTVG